VTLRHSALSESEAGERVLRDAFAEMMPVACGTAHAEARSTKKNSQSPGDLSLSTSLPLVPLCLRVRSLNCTSHHGSMPILWDLGMAERGRTRAQWKRRFCLSLLDLSLLDRTIGPQGG